MTPAALIRRAVAAESVTGPAHGHGSEPQQLWSAHAHGAGPLVGTRGYDRARYDRTWFWSVPKAVELLTGKLTLAHATRRFECVGALPANWRSVGPRATKREVTPILVPNVVLRLDEPEEELIRRAAKRLRLPERAICRYAIVR